MNLLVFEAFRILTRNVFPQNLALKQHLRKSDSIKMDGKHSIIGVPDFLIHCAILLIRCLISSVA